MELLLSGLLVVALAGVVTLLVLWLKAKRSVSAVVGEARARLEQSASRQKAIEAQFTQKLEEQNRVATERTRQLESQLAAVLTENKSLSKWSVVVDAERQAETLLREAAEVLRQSQSDAEILIQNAQRQYDEAIAKAELDAQNLSSEARAKSKLALEQAQSAVNVANERAVKIVSDAEARAEQIAGKAYEAVRNAEHYERTVRAMKNIIEGYGDEYLVPAESLLDDLAEEFSHKDAGQRLKLSRDNTKAMIKNGTASRCEYVEAGRREGAERFVLDAFNGKVDSILSRVRHDNVGTLEEEIRDAFTLVNHGGRAFRDARITDEYLDARLEELRWACIAQELRRQEQEEQRLIREQIREEEKARKEFERAMKEAAKDEEVLRKAMAKAEAQIAEASNEQKQKFEAQLAELNAKLKEAEDRNRRALSMAQQTKRGHVYIISNVGSFGENTYKIGLTRRLEPLDRIRELGDSSVPFEFDVHALIMSEDAPALECQLHKHFLMNQVNKVNHRKEFFRASLADIRREIESLGLAAKWTMTAEAREYRETLAIEEAIAKSPEAKTSWLNRQLTLDPIDYRVDDGREN